MAAPAISVASYLTQQKKTNNKDLASEWTILELYYNEK